MKKHSKTSSLLSRLGFVASIAVAAAATPAYANGTRVDAIGGPTLVEFPSGQLSIQYNSINYFGFPGTVCSGTYNIETVKAWQSLAQSALLAGKTLQIYYNDCVVGGQTVHYLNDVVLVK